MPRSSGICQANIAAYKQTRICPMPLLQVDNITRSFGSTRALSGAHFSIERGEIVALMGANGAGKSTLVKA